MCKWGTHTKVELFEIDLSGLTREQNKLRAKKLGLIEKGELIDSCIAPLVQMLNDHGIKTIASCCGHGKLNYSVIWLHPKHLKFGERAYTKTLNKLLIKIFSYFVRKLAIDNSQMRLELKFPYKEKRDEPCRILESHCREIHGKQAEYSLYAPFISRNPSRKRR